MAERLRTTRNRVIGERDTHSHAKHVTQELASKTHRYGSLALAGASPKAGRTTIGSPDDFTSPEAASRAAHRFTMTWSRPRNLLMIGPAGAGKTGLGTRLLYDMVLRTDHAIRILAGDNEYHFIAPILAARATAGAAPGRERLQYLIAERRTDD